MCTICYQCTMYVHRSKNTVLGIRLFVILSLIIIFIRGSSQFGQVKAGHYFQVSYYIFPQNLVCTPALCYHEQFETPAFGLSSC